MSGTSLKNLNIVFCINQKYSLPAFVTMLSILEYLPKHVFVNFFILYYQLDNTVFAVAEDLFITSKSCIQFIDCSPYFQKENFSAALNPHWTKENFLPLFIPSLFSQFDRTICMDADMLVRGDISQLPDLLPSKAKIAAVPCMIRKLTANINRPLYDIFFNYSRNVIQLKKPENYCNGGLIVFNHALITKEDSKQCFELLNKGWDACEEPIFNKVFEDDLAHLPATYNFYIDAYLQQPNYPQHCRLEWEEAHKNPLIFHYIGPKKPWNTLNLPFETEYNKIWNRLIEKIKECSPKIVLKTFSNPPFLIS